MIEPKNYLLHNLIARFSFFFYCLGARLCGRHRTHIAIIIIITIAVYTQTTRRHR